jgi:asparagine synthase (glutamine-hydrolysing)
MCGIVGITWKDRKLTAAMAARVAHRGPDQSGLYEDAFASLGHQRLSILDLSERGRQPMCSDDGSVVVVFNGEVYNFGEIRRKLELCRLRKHVDSVWQQPL